MAEQAKSEAITPKLNSELKQISATKDELRNQLKAAVNAEDWVLSSKLSSELKRLEVAEQQRALEQAQLAAKAITEQFKSVIDKAIGKTIAELEGVGKLDKLDGVWYSMDFGDAMENGTRPSSCRVLKTPAKPSSGKSGGGAGKKFPIGYKELLAEFGSRPVTADDSKYRSKLEGHEGQSWQEAYDSDTDGNYRYAIREALLHKKGLI